MKVSRILLLSALAASVNTHAQLAIAPVAGLNTSYAYTAIDDHLYKSNNVGLKAGLLGELEITDNLYFQMGAL